MHCLLLQLGGNIFESGEDRWKHDFRVKVEVWGERWRNHVVGEEPSGRAGDIDARWAREAHNTHCGILYATTLGEYEKIK
jgi:hypothetical protein